MFYTEMNPQIEAMSKIPRVEIIKNYNQDIIDDHKASDGHLWCVVDDHILHNIYDKMASVFAIKSRAKFVSISFLTQNLYSRGGNAAKFGRELLINSSILILFCSKRNESVMNNLARTTFSSRYRYFKDVFNAVCKSGKSGHNYLAIFLDPTISSKYELRSKIFFRDQNTILFWERK